MSQNNISKAQVENIEAITQLTADNKLVLVQKNGVGDDYDYIKKTTGIVEKPEEGSLDLITSGGVEKYILPKKYNYESSNIKLDSPQSVQLLDFTMSGYHNRGGNLNTLTIRVQPKDATRSEVISSSFYVVVSDGEHSYVSKEKNSSTSGECVFTFDENSFVVSGKDLLVYFVETRDANAQKVCVKLDSAMKEVFDSSWCTVSFLETGGKYVRVNDVTPYFKLSVVQSETMQHFPTGDVHTTDIERKRWNNKISQLTFKRELGNYGESVSQYLSWFAIGTQHMQLSAHQQPITIVKIAVNKGDNTVPSGQPALTTGDLKMIVWQFAGDGDKSFVAISKNSVNVYEKSQGEKVVFEFEPFVFDDGYSLRCGFVDAKNPSWWNNSIHVSLIRYEGTVNTQGETGNDGRQTRIDGTGDSSIHYGRIVLADVYYGCGSNVDTEPIEESMAPVTSDALYKHVHDADVHITEEEKETLARLVIDTEVTKDSPNLITSGAVYKNNEFLNGSDIQEDWMVGKEVHRINNYPHDGRGNSMFSYKPIDYYFYKDTKIASLEIPLKYNDGEVPYSSPVKLLVYGVNGAQDNRYDVANLTFIGLSSNSVNIADDIEKLTFDFETPFGGFDEYMFGIVDATKADALYADSSNYNTPIGYYDGTGVDEGQRILVDVRIGAIDGTGAEGEDAYHTWKTPWNTDTMPKNEWDYNIVPVKFHTASYKDQLDDMKHVIHVTQDENGYSFSLGEDSLSTSKGISIGDCSHSNDGTISFGSNSGTFAVVYGKDGGNNINIGSSTNSIGNTNMAIGFEAMVGSATEEFDAVPLSNSVSIGRGAKTTASNATAIGLSAENKQSGSLLLRASSTALLGNDGERYADFILDCDGNVKVEKTVIVGGQEKTTTDTIVTEDTLEELDFFDKVEITKTDKELTDISTFVLSFTMNTFSYKALTGDLYEPFTKGINKIGCVFGACTPVDFRMLVLGVGDKRTDAATRFRLDNLSFLGLSNKVESRAIDNGEVVYFDFDTPFFMPETKEVLVMFIKDSVASRFDDKQVHNVSSTDCATIKVGLLHFNNSQLNDNYHWWQGSYNLESMGAGNANGYALDLRFFGIIDVPHPKNSDVHFDDKTQKKDVIDHLTDMSMHLSQADRDKLNNAVQESDLSNYVTTTAFNTHTGSGIHFDTATEHQCVVAHISSTYDWKHFDNSTQKKNITEHLCAKNSWMHFGSSGEYQCVTKHIVNQGVYVHYTQSQIEGIVDARLSGYSFVTEDEFTTHTGNTNVHFTDKEEKCSVLRHIENTCIHVNADEKKKIHDALTAADLDDYVTDDEFACHVNKQSVHFVGTEKADMQASISNMVAHINSGDMHFDSSEQKTNVTNHVDKESTCFTTWHLTTEDRCKIAKSIDADALSKALEGYVLTTTFEEHTTTNDIHFDDSAQKTNVLTATNAITTHIGNDGIHVTAQEKADIAKIDTHIKDGTIHHTQSDIENIVDGKMSGYVTTGTFNAHAEAKCLHFESACKKKDVYDHIENACIHHTTPEIEEIVAGKMSGYALDKDLTDHIGDSDVHFTGSEKSTMQKDITDLKTHANDDTIHHTANEIGTIVDGKMSGYVTIGTFEGHTGDTDVHFTGESEKKKVIDHVSFESDCFYNYHLKSGDRNKIDTAVDQGTLDAILEEYVTYSTFNDHVGDTTHLTADDRKKLNNAVEASELLNYVTETDFNNHVGDTTHLSTADRTKLNNAIDSSYLNNYVTTGAFASHTSDNERHLTGEDRCKLSKVVVQEDLCGYVNTDTFNNHAEAQCIHFTNADEKDKVIDHVNNNGEYTHLTTDDRTKLDTAVTSTAISNIVYMTQGEYDSLEPKDAQTFYIIAEG